MERGAIRTGGLLALFALDDVVGVAIQLIFISMHRFAFAAHMPGFVILLVVVFGMVLECFQGPLWWSFCASRCVGSRVVVVGVDSSKKTVSSLSLVVVFSSGSIFTGISLHTMLSPSQAMGRLVSA